MASPSAAAAKVDLKKSFKTLYTAPTGTPVMVTVPALNVLCVDGEGNPNTSADFQNAIGALYTLAYTLKFALKASGSTPYYVVMPLEALWWTPGTHLLSEENKGGWGWRAMIVQPDFVLPDHVEAARQEAIRKKNVPMLDRVALELFDEGLCAQILHIGPWDMERPTIERLHVFIAESGYQLAGKHHEIYLSDPSRTAPDKLRTIVRQPVATLAAP